MRGPLAVERTSAAMRLRGAIRPWERGPAKSSLQHRPGSEARDFGAPGRLATLVRLWVALKPPLYDTVGCTQYRTCRACGARGFAGGKVWHADWCLVPMVGEWLIDAGRV